MIVLCHSQLYSVIMSVIYKGTSAEEQTFENFCTRVNEMISEEELDVMKQCVKDYFGEELMDIQTFPLLIQELIGKRHISSSHLALLKEMLYSVGRKDLIELAIEDKDIKTNNRKTKYVDTDRERVSITVRIKFSSCTVDHVQELLRKLSDVVFAPANHIKVNRIEQLSTGGFICVLGIDKTYADILQHYLVYDDGNSGLNYCGVTDVFICNTTYKIKGKMVPIEMLQEHQRVIAHLHKQNQELMQRLDQLGMSLDSLLPLVAELGDPNTHLKNLENLHKHSGMSTTLWKVLGRLSDEQLPDRYKPDLSQEEIRQNCLYSKARMQRVFPHLSMSFEKKQIDKKEKNSLSKSD
ncbi:uncharacterized protein LOC123552433 [Mercenaria mercenaria]|uniref:uncharacterized protein LOC123552433 n=1 Tax=Mercenaria mercenaria TaxID=6596 RepID=UPI00234EB279|nr:uncharacterized protein LOC123552433 [Mercenaria mercenaria]